MLVSPRRRARDDRELAGFTGAYEPQVDEDLVEWVVRGLRGSDQ